MNKCFKINMFKNMTYFTLSQNYTQLLEINLKAVALVIQGPSMLLVPGLPNSWPQIKLSILADEVY